MKMLLLFLISSNLSAAVIEDCGSFKLKGHAVVDDKTKAVHFVILRETKSEMKFAVSDREDILKIAGLKDNGIELIGTIPRRLDGMKGELKNISNVHTVLIDTLNTKEDIELLKIEKCLPAS